jgi:hypothetical protein
VWRERFSNLGGSETLVSGAGAAAMANFPSNLSIIRRVLRNLELSRGCHREPDFDQDMIYLGVH